MIVVLLRSLNHSFSSALDNLDTFSNSFLKLHPLLNVSKLIRSVEEKKLIARIIGKVDKRQMYFSLTAEGKEQIHTIKNSNHKMPALLQQVVDMLEK